MNGIFDALLLKFKQKLYVYLHKRGQSLQNFAEKVLSRRTLSLQATLLALRRSRFPLLTLVNENYYFFDDNSDKSLSLNANSIVQQMQVL